jgi:hypothetical protein
MSSNPGYGLLIVGSEKSFTCSFVREKSAMALTVVVQKRGARKISPTNHDVNTGMQQR